MRSKRWVRANHHVDIRTDRGSRRRSRAISSPRSCCSPRPAGKVMAIRPRQLPSPARQRRRLRTRLSEFARRYLEIRMSPACSRCGAGGLGEVVPFRLRSGLPGRSFRAAALAKDRGAHRPGDAGWTLRNADRCWRLGLSGPDRGGLGGARFARDGRSQPMSWNGHDRGGGSIHAGLRAMAAPSSGLTICHISAAR